MAELPKLSESLRRLHALRWKDLIKRHGFTGGHFKWHESRVRRHEAAKPAFSLAPPPPAPLRHSGHSVTYFGSRGEPVSYENWRRQQIAAWTARENDPAVIDSIAINETMALAKARFVDIVGDYLSVWTDTNGDSDEFTRWLEDIGVLVGREVGDLWRRGEWHVAWFERACRNKLEEALRPLIEEWQSRACGLEILHLRNPQLSLRSLLASGGDLNLAVTLEGGEQAIASAQRLLDSLQVSDSANLSADRPVDPPEPSAARSAAGEQPGTAANTAAPSSGFRHRAADPAAHGRPRPTPALKWEDVDISFLSDERIQVQIVSQRATYNYAEFGCMDKRTGRPNKVWEILKTLALAHGVIPDINRPANKSWPAMEKQLEKLRKLLKYQFHLSEDPLPFRRGTGYRLQCKIGNAASFDS